MGVHQYIIKVVSLVLAPLTVTISTLMLAIVFFFSADFQHHPMEEIHWFAPLNLEKLLISAPMKRGFC
jgi:hypothetical protein